MKSRLLIIIGIAMMIVGFSIVAYVSIILVPTTIPPTMKPIEGIDRFFSSFRQAFLFSAIAGIFVTIVGIAVGVWRKRK